MLGERSEGPEAGSYRGFTGELASPPHQPNAATLQKGARSLRHSARLEPARVPRALSWPLGPSLEISPYPPPFLLAATVARAAPAAFGRAALVAAPAPVAAGSDAARRPPAVRRPVGPAPALGALVGEHARFLRARVAVVEVLAHAAHAHLLRGRGKQRTNLPRRHGDHGTFSEETQDAPLGHPRLLRLPLRRRHARLPNGGPLRLSISSSLVAVVAPIVLPSCSPAMLPFALRRRALRVMLDISA